MRIPISAPRLTSAFAFASIVVAATALGAADDKMRPSVSLKASPSTGFAPTRIVLTAELKGGANDYADFYCPTVEWNWGDDTRSESKVDCDPYEVGKSEIRRRYAIDRIFQSPGTFRVEFRLKQKDKVVGAGSTTVTIRPGLRDGNQVTAGD